MAAFDAEAQAEKHERLLLDAFLASIAAIASSVVVSAIVEALQRGDVDAAVEALAIEPAAFVEFEEQLRRAYIEAGVASVAALLAGAIAAGRRPRFRFDPRNARAERWLSDHVRGLTTALADEQRAIARTMFREGLSQGRNPRRLVRDLLGQSRRGASGRVGGLLGLSRPLSDAATRALDELQNGDFDAYLRRALRDKRFDSTVRKAMKGGGTLTPDQADRIADAYRRRLTVYRANTIAQTEAFSAVEKAQSDNISNLIGSGQVSADEVRKQWRSVRDNRVRDTHAGLDGQIRRVDEPFQSSSGALMMYPHDTSLGAGPSEIVNCRCSVKYLLNWSEGREQ